MKKVKEVQKKLSKKSEGKPAANSGQSEQVFLFKVNT